MEDTKLHCILRFISETDCKNSQPEQRFSALSVSVRQNCSTKPPSNWFGWQRSTRIYHRPCCSNKPPTHFWWLNHRSIGNMPSTLCSPAIGTQSVVNANTLSAATSKPIKCSRIANGVWQKITFNIRLANRRSHWRNWTKLAVLWRICCVHRVYKVQRSRVLSSANTSQRRKPIWSKRVMPTYCWIFHCRESLANQFECLWRRRHHLPHRM